MSLHGTSCALSDPKQFCVRVCGCGVVHLSFGPSIVNVSAELVPFLAETLLSAAKEMKHLKMIATGVKEEASIDPSGNLVYGNFQKH